MYFCTQKQEILIGKKHKTKKKGSIKAKKSTENKFMTTKDNITSRKHDVWTAILTIIGLIVVYIALMLHADDAEPLQAYLSSLADAGCFYTNGIALVATAYNKATGNFDVRGRVYILSILGNFLVAHIFAQAIFMVYPEVKLYAEFMRTKWFAIVGVLLFFVIIFAISCSEGMLEYTKEPITKEPITKRRK